MVCNGHQEANCSAARALDAVSEPWSPLILQDALFHGTSRFATFVANLEIAPEILSTRLNDFVSAGLMQLHRDAELPNGQEYLLTEKGRDLAPTMIALSHWGDRWIEQGEDRVVYEHEGCGGILEQLIRCDTCGQNPTLDDVHPRAAADTEVLVAALDTEHLDLPDGPDLATIPIDIGLLGAFVVRIAGIIVGPLSAGTQRVLAYLAIHDRPVTRIAMAGTMWPDVTEHHAGGSLRSALSRLDGPTRDSILMASAGLQLDDGVNVDFREAKALADRILRDGSTPDEADLSSDAVAVLSMDLLPDWYDDWVIDEAENWRYLRRNALEVQADHLTSKGHLSRAAVAARAAIAVDTLRESPQALLIRIHLATGNQSEAIKTYEQYRQRLMTELGLEPTAHLSDLVQNIRHP